MCPDGADSIFLKVPCGVLWHHGIWRGECTIVRKEGTPSRNDYWSRSWSCSNRIDWSGSSSIWDWRVGICRYRVGSCHRWLLSHWWSSIIILGWVVVSGYRSVGISWTSVGSSCNRSPGILELRCPLLSWQDDSGRWIVVDGIEITSSWHHIGGSEFQWSLLCARTGRSSSPSSLLTVGAENSSRTMTAFASTTTVASLGRTERLSSRRICHSCCHVVEGKVQQERGSEWVNSLWIWSILGISSSSGGRWRCWLWRVSNDKGLNLLRLFMISYARGGGRTGVLF